MSLDIARLSQHHFLILLLLLWFPKGIEGRGVVCAVVCGGSYHLLDNAKLLVDVMDDFPQELMCLADLRKIFVAFVLKIYSVPIRLFNFYTRA